MTAVVLLQIDRLNETQRAVRGHFQEGGSVAMVLQVLLGLAAIVLLAYLITAWQERSRVTVEPADPWNLFHDLADKTSLTTQQRRFLEEVVGDAGLSQPAVILLSQSLFDQHARTVTTADRDSALKRGEERDIVGATRRALFPDA